MVLNKVNSIKGQRKPFYACLFYGVLFCQNMRFHLHGLCFLIQSKGNKKS